LPLVLLGLSDDVLFESFSSSTECWNFVWIIECKTLIEAEMKNSYLYLYQSLIF
jgi:hypothetical protein